MWPATLVGSVAAIPRVEEAVAESQAHLKGFFKHLTSICSISVMWL
jgi:hypothetical protein